MIRDQDIEREKGGFKMGNLYEEPGLLRLYTTFGFT